MVFGLLLGYPVSYWFQPPVVRMFASLGDYFVNLRDVMTTEGMGPRVLLTMLGCAIIGAIVGQTVNGIVKAKQPAQE